MPVPVPVPVAAETSTPEAAARDAAHAIQQGEHAPDAWLTPDQLNSKYGTSLQVHTGSDQGVRILDPRVAEALDAGEDEEHVR